MRNKYPEFTGFEWDAGNKEKNLKHGVHASECEQVFFNEPLVILDDPKHSVAEDRFAALDKRIRAGNSLSYPRNGPVCSVSFRPEI